MSKLRSVRTEIAKMKKELEAKEAAYRKEALAPSVDVLAKTLLDDEEFCEVLEQYSKDEVRVIAKHIAGNMSRIIRESDADIGALREKKKERAARRKAAKESAEVMEPVRDEQVDTGAETAGTDGWSPTGWTPAGERNPFGQN